jgi:hypothetical protein
MYEETYLEARVELVGLGLIHRELKEEQDKLIP